jgi:predicted nucleic acid-binding protein
VSVPEGSRPKVGLDTSVVLRLLVGAPAGQAQAALGFVRSQVAAGTRVVVTDLVVSESYFALHAHYGVPKREAVSALLEMLRSGLVEAADGPGVEQVLAAPARASAKLGLVDRLIHEQYRRAGATLATFERAAGRMAATRVLR